MKMETKRFIIVFTSLLSIQFLVNNIIFWIHDFKFIMSCIIPNLFLSFILLLFSACSEHMVLQDDSKVDSIIRNIRRLIGIRSKPGSIKELECAIENCNRIIETLARKKKNSDCEELKQLMQSRIRSFEEHRNELIKLLDIESFKNSSSLIKAKEEKLKKIVNMHTRVIECENILNNLK